MGINQYNDHIIIKHVLQASYFAKSQESGSDPEKHGDFPRQFKSLIYASSYENQMV